MERKTVAMGLACLALGVFSGACSLEVPGAKDAGALKILLDERDPAAFFSSLMLEDPIRVMAPTTISDFNCFIVNVTGPSISGNALLPADCAVSDNFRGRGPGIMPFPVPRGRTIEVTISAASQARQIDVYGIYPPVSECGGTSTPGSTKEGYFLGGTQAVIDEAKSVTIPVSFSGTAASFSCTEHAGGGGAEFGTAGDGDQTYVASTASNTALTNGRIFSRAKNITNISADGLTITTAAFGAADYAVGDEVMFYVNGEKNTTDCSTVANEFFPGQHGFGRVSAVNIGSGLITLDQPIVPTPGAIVTANLTAAANTANFCSIQIVRVPNFNNLTLNSASAILLTPQAFSYTNGFGGVLPIRVRGDLTVTGGGAHAIHANALGFPGGSGVGIQGMSSVAQGGSAGTANAQGGGGTAAAGGGGGGGVGGAGGTGGTGSASDGAGGAGLACSGMSCFVLGAGGGASSGAGGIGGGFIMLMAKNIVSSGGSTLGVSANGQAGANSTDGGGGGAGGIVFMRTKTNASFLNLSASGGGGGTGTDGGGGGSGGMIQFNYCSGSGAAIQVIAGTGASGGGNGAPGQSNPVLDPGAAMCAVP